jgi:methanogenic corrinoid protein MtbC1
MEPCAQLHALREEIAGEVVDRHYRMNPRLAQLHGPEGRSKCLEDTLHHVSYLAEAASVERPTLFTEYTAWMASVLTARAVPVEDFRENLGLLREVIQEKLPATAFLAACVDAGLAQLRSTATEPPTFLPPEGPHAALARGYLDALLDGKRHQASRLVMDAVKSGVPVRDLYLHVIQKAQYEIGRLWQLNRVSVAQEHYCTAAAQFIISQLYPHIFSHERNGRTVVATCVSGDLHEIGVRMVADFFEMDGWDSFYLGANTPSDSVLETVAQRGASVLAISATMTAHVEKVRSLIAQARKTSALSGVRIIVGGFPFNLEPNLWRRVGADGHARSAEEAVALANALVSDGVQAA